MTPSNPASNVARMTDGIASAKRILTVQARALVQLGEGLGEDFERALEIILASTGRVACTGIGKSGHVARKIAATLASTGTPAFYVHPSEASHGDLGMIAPCDIVLALSKSGETGELADIIQFARRFGNPLIGMTSVPSSSLAVASTQVLILPDAPEACAETSAPTTSTTMMMALGDCLAIALLELRGFKAQDFRNFHPGGKLGARLTRVSDLMHPRSELPLRPYDASLQDGLGAMSAGKLGCVILLRDEGNVAGIVTDGDIRRFLASNRVTQNIADIMTENPKSLEADHLAADALRIMNEQNISQILIYETNALVGLVHLHDLLRAGIA